MEDVRRRQAPGLSPEGPSHSPPHCRLLTLNHAPPPTHALDHRARAIQFSGKEAANPGACPRGGVVLPRPTTRRPPANCLAALSAGLAIPQLFVREVQTRRDDLGRRLLLVLPGGGSDRGVAWAPRGPLGNETSPPPPCSDVSRQADGQASQPIAARRRLAARRPDQWHAAGRGGRGRRASRGAALPGRNPKRSRRHKMAAAGATAATGVPGPVAPAAAAGTPCSASAAPGSQGVLIGDRLYSGVLITLENCLLPDDKLRFTPSMSSGLDTDTETDLRVVGCELIQAAGILLRLPQVRARPRAEITAAPARGRRLGPLLVAGRAQPRPPALTASGAPAQHFAATGPPRVGSVHGASVGVYDVSVFGCESPTKRGDSVRSPGIVRWDTVESLLYSRWLWRPGRCCSSASSTPSPS